MSIEYDRLMSDYEVTLVNDNSGFLFTSPELYKQMLIWV